MKLKSFLLVALVAGMVACTSPDSLVEDFVAACEAGDVKEMVEVAKEIDELDEDLTKEQNEKCMEALNKLAPEVFEEYLKLAQEAEEAEEE